MTPDKFTFQVTWSHQDEEFVAVCLEWPSMSFLAHTREDALAGIMRTVAGIIEEGI